MTQIIQNLIIMIKKDFEDLTKPNVNSVQNEYIETLQTVLEQIEAVDQNLDLINQSCESNQNIRHLVSLSKTLLNL